MNVRKCHCVVCGRLRDPYSGGMCVACKMAYDRLNRRDCTTYGLLRWAAARARKFERAKTGGGR